MLNSYLINAGIEDEQEESKLQVKDPVSSYLDL